MQVEGPQASRPARIPADGKHMLRSMKIAVYLAALVAIGGSAAAQPARIVALGDSNTAGFGVATAEAFPARLEATLRAMGVDVEVSNAGISGDTTTGMLNRLDRAVPEGTRIAIVQGGYNDLRRGSSRAAIAANVEAILSRLRARRIQVILCGFYDEPWEAIAKRHRAIYVPSSSCYDAANRGWDGLHMNAAGHRVVTERLVPVVQRLVTPVRGQRR